MAICLPRTCTVLHSLSPSPTLSQTQRRNQSIQIKLYLLLKLNDIIKKRSTYTHMHIHTHIHIIRSLAAAKEQTVEIAYHLITFTIRMLKTNDNDMHTKTHTHTNTHTHADTHHIYRDGRQMSAQWRKGHSKHMWKIARAAQCKSKMVRASAGVSNAQNNKKYPFFCLSSISPITKNCPYLGTKFAANFRLANPT